MATLHHSYSGILPWTTIAPTGHGQVREARLRVVARLWRSFRRQPAEVRSIAIEAIDLTTVSPTLAVAMQDNSNLEMDWLWCATKVHTVRERRYCLQRAMAINPTNDLCRHELTMLQPRPAA